jgi:tetratricopeptide (TPR) repeat protein
MRRVFFYSFLSLVLFGQCKSDNTSTAGETAAVSLSSLESTLESDPSPANATKVVNEINKLIASTDATSEKNSLIAKGLKISKTHNLGSKAAGFLTMGMRNNMAGLDKKESILELAGIMATNRKIKTANVLNHAFVDLYPQDSRSATISENIAAVAGGDVHAYLLKIAESIFEDPDNYGINRKNSSEYVNACEAYALSYNDERAPEYLFKAAEIARSLRTFPKTLSLFDWIINSYPDYEKTATALFLKGFIIENELQNEDLARKTYQSFLTKYPDHDLADDVQFLVDNLGKTNEEILKLIEQNKQNQENQ